MIDKKLLLYVALGVVVFALWEAWQKDYSQTNQTPTAITSNNISKEPSANNVSIPQNTATPTTTKNQSNLLEIPSSRLIKVHTDVLDVAIDSVGGNVVKADLLKYKNVIYQDQPVQFLNDDSTKYYIAESGLVGEQGPDLNNKQAQYSFSQKEYTLDKGQENIKVKLVWSGGNGVTVFKIFTFTKNKYDIVVDYEINNKSNKEWSGQFYAQIERKNFDPSKGLFHFSTYTGGAISSLEVPYQKVSFSDIESAVKNKNGFLRDSQGGWAAMQQRYFLSVWVPDQTKTYRYFSNLNNGIYTIGFGEKAITVSPGKTATISSILYVGPETADNMGHLAKGLDRTVDYGWLWPISIMFFWILKNIYKFIGNWGWSIILITILIKAVFYKLSESSCRSMARMRELMPKMQALKERYGDDRQKLQQATMELYKKEKINPLNLGGCLPMIVQIPFFIALYYVLISAVELRHSPFMFWIHDLSAPDPFYILPILMGISMFLQQRLSPTSADPTQAKMMMFMPVIFTFFFLNFPSGLVLYWLVSNILSILQQWYINRRLAAGVMICRKP
ncbi:MAG: membrane protein insertase YidC [Gammaproteobacteria bacterium]|nr:membrane protein insertase YidC [Gammaproteobacteria bacterium]